MRVPERLEPLLEQGVIEEVLRPLMSGKEAEVFLVLSGGEERVAKVYKNAQYRSFQHRTDYTEGRSVRSSREQRAMNKRSKHGRAKTEDAWRSAEVDAIHLLRSAGVRVPQPFAFTEGVLVMELVKGEDGAPAPRLVDVQFTEEEATEVFHILLRDVVKMLCAGLIHADLSDFNVLMSPTGPVIIDFPQAVDPARNQSARKLLIRDVKNITSFLGRFAPRLRRTQYGPEMWDLYERSELDPATELTGKYQPKESKTEVSSLLEDILAVEQEARERREELGLPPPRRARRPVVYQPPPPKVAPKPKPKPKKQGRPKQQHRGGKPDPAQQGQQNQHAAPTGDAPKKRRRRRRKRSGGQGSQSEQPSQNPQNGQSAAPRPPAQTGPKPSTGDQPGAPRKRRRRRRRRGGGGKPPGSASSS
jgi:RIO kinase 1